jgi:hypothetical protein
MIHQVTTNAINSEAYIKLHLVLLPLVTAVIALLAAIIGWKTAKLNFLIKVREAETILSTVIKKNLGCE